MLVAAIAHLFIDGRVDVIKAAPVETAACVVPRPDQPPHGSPHSDAVVRPTGRPHTLISTSDIISTDRPLANQRSTTRPPSRVPFGNARGTDVNNLPTHAFTDTK